MRTQPLSMAIIGAGRVGSALALSLCRTGGYRLRFIVSRSVHSAETLARAAGQGTVATMRDLLVAGVDVVWLTVPDRELGRLATHIAAGGPFQGSPLFVHTSGCLSIEALRALRGVGQLVAGLHPLQAVAERNQPLRPGTFYTLELEGDRPELLRQVVADLHGRLLRVSASKKALYHAAAAVASNYLVVLAESAFAMLAACGLEAHQVSDALSALVTGTWDNVARLGPAEALTGPIQRGDLQIIGEHLLAVGMLGDRSLLDLYTVLGRRAVELAERQGSLDAAQVKALNRLLGGPA